MNRLPQQHRLVTAGIRRVRRDRSRGVAIPAGAAARSEVRPAASSSARSADGAGFRDPDGADESGETGHRQEAQRDARGALRSRRTRRCRGQDDARQARASRPARETAERHDLGAARGHDAGGDSREGAVPGRVPAAAAPEPSRRRDAVPEVPHRRDQEAGGPRPHALRPRLRPARSLPARVPAADLPDHAARPRRRLEGQARHHRQLRGAVQGHAESEADSKDCGCWSRRSRSSSSTRPPTGAARRRAAA